MNLYKEQMLKHGVEWRKHKYIRKEGNRYIYPEDVKNKATAAANIAENLTKGAATAAGTKLSNMKDKATSIIADQKQNLKDKKYVRDSKPKRNDSHETLVSKHPYARQIQQLTSAHQTATERTGNGLYSSGRNGENNHHEAPGVDEQKEKTKQRKQAAIDAKSEDQRKSAHIGSDHRRTTEELYWQMERTAKRKKAKEQNKKKEDDQIRSAHNNYTIRERRKVFPSGADAPSLEKEKNKTAYRKWKEKSYPKQKYSANQAESERQQAAPTLSKEYRDAMGYAPSLDEQIEKTKKRKKVKYVKSLYNN